MITKDLAVYAKSLTADAAIKFKLDWLVFIAMPELFGLFANINPIMLRGKLGSMVILFTLRAEMSIFGNAVNLGWFRRNFSAIITERRLWLLLLVSIHHIVDDVDGKNLIVLEDHVLMLEDLGVLLFIVEIDRFKSIRTWNRIVKEFSLVVAVRFSHWNLVHYTTHLFLSIFYLVESHIENHTDIWKFISFLTNFEDFIVLV
jgi:hypothetical protein